MGNHRHIVVNIVCWNDHCDEKLSTFRDHLCDTKLLVGPILVNNGFEFWTLMDNGSKLGWDGSVYMEKKREQLIDLLTANSGWEGGIKCWSMVELYHECMEENVSKILRSNT